ncbi:MAG: class I SAM-dependent methyltransferase [Bacteroidales bacterium]|nr:class I SAM-dependent methyltransferase [Bacteroidales bacterium]
MNLIPTSCYNCNILDSEYYDDENGYTYVKCVKCGLVYLNPRPANEEISAANESGLHKGENEINITGFYSEKKVNRYLKILSHFYNKNELASKMNWLDIGCGFGEFMESIVAYSNSNLEVNGSEPNMQKVDSCKKRKLHVDFIDLYAHYKTYNFVSLLNVYSHIPNPKEFLKKIKELLKPGGELFIETGHSSHLPAKYHHKPYYAPDHLSFANQVIVEEILKRIGFNIIKTKIYRHQQFISIDSIKSFIYYCYKFFIKRDLSIAEIFPKFPKRDMYIRAKLVDDPKE